MQTKPEVLDYLKPLPLRTTVTEALIQQIISLIKQAGLQPGDRLPSEKEIMAATKASRPSVREALCALKTIGVIETRPGAGSFLARPEPADAIRSELIELALMNEDYRDILEARRVLESAIVRRIVGQGLRQIPEAEAALRRMEELAEGGEDIFQVSSGFHVTVAKSGGSPVLEKLVGVLFQVITDVQAKVYWPKANMKEQCREHRELYLGIVSGDEERAIAAVNKHLDDILETIAR